MSAFHPDPTPHPVHTVHRFGAAAVGAFLLVFALLSFLRPITFMPGRDVIVMGLATSGALAVVSVVVGIVLITAAMRGGRVASTVAVVVGAGFLLSGLVNATLLDTGVTVFGFRLSNVLFSIAVGFVLLVFGAYGRFTGSLPDDSPYAEVSTPTDSTVRDVPAPVDGASARTLADAERAVAGGTASAVQVAGVDAARRYGSHAERSRAFRGATDRPAA